jgi:hypothetical protein
MKMKKVIGLFVTLLVCSAAQSEDYNAVSITKMDIESGVTSIDLYSFSGTVGKELSDNMSGELRLGIGVEDHTAHFDDDSYIETDVNYHFGAYLKFSTSSGDMSPYAILGITNLNATVYDSFTDESFTDSQDDISYGLGVDFGNGFNIEVMQYLDTGGQELNGLSLGMRF